ncbi:hypothetical protein BT69DRAFT_1291869 [Atractiella rhizophila]|nr:hypothetical protein BT69DRAFT_1291869 [Atractiella rhizophila]
MATIVATMGTADLDQFCHLLHLDPKPWLEGPPLFSDEWESSSIILPLVKAFSAFLRLPVDHVQTVQLFRKPSLSRFDPLPLAYSSYECLGEDPFNMRDDSRDSDSDDMGQAVLPGDLKAISFNLKCDLNPSVLIGRTLIPPANFNFKRPRKSSHVRVYTFLRTLRDAIQQHLRAGVSCLATIKSVVNTVKQDIPKDSKYCIKVSLLNQWFPEPPEPAPPILRLVPVPPSPHCDYIPHDAEDDTCYDGSCNSTLMSLPVELLVMIAGCLDLKSVQNLQLTSKHFVDPCRQEIFSQIKISKATACFPLLFALSKTPSRSCMGRAVPKVDSDEKAEPPQYITFPLLKELTVEPQHATSVHTINWLLEMMPSISKLSFVGSSFVTVDNLLDNVNIQEFDIGTLKDSPDFTGSQFCGDLERIPKMIVNFKADVRLSGILSPQHMQKTLAALGKFGNLKSLSFSFVDSVEQERSTVEEVKKKMEEFCEERKMELRALYVDRDLRSPECHYLLRFTLREGTDPRPFKPVLILRTLRGLAS